MPPLRGSRAAVLGLGKFGGSAGAIRWLAAQGAHVIVSDKAPASKLASGIEALRALIQSGQVEVRTGQQDRPDIEGASIVVASAAVPMPWQNSLLNDARRAGSIVTTEIALALRELAGTPTVAVTGSAGKSTTTTLIHRGLEAAGCSTWLGGNIGGSLLDLAGASATRPTWLVLELSSAQLWWLSAEAMAWGGMGTGTWSPTIGVLTNVAPNHVDWHGSIRHYVASKAGIVPSGGTALLSSQDQVLTAALRRHVDDAPWWPVDPTRLPEVPPLLLPGQHNRRNAGLALAAIEAVMSHPASRGTAHLMSDATTAVSQFRGLPHRLELVGEVEGVRCYNDSKSTTPGSTRLAVASFIDPGRIHLIVGGYDKGVDLGPIRELAPQLAGLYAIGQTGPTMALPEPWSDCGTLEVAVERALGRSHAGDILLLSPGCASWDQFSDFEARGDAFAALCRSSRPRLHRADTIPS